MEWTMTRYVEIFGWAIMCVIFVYGVLAIAGRL
jgi:hypothetical protein